MVIPHSLTQEIQPQGMKGTGQSILVFRISVTRVIRAGTQDFGRLKIKAINGRKTALWMYIINIPTEGI